MRLPRSLGTERAGPVHDERFLVLIGLGRLWFGGYFRYACD
jgi:hypothetical protein